MDSSYTFPNLEDASAGETADYNSLPSASTTNPSNATNGTLYGSQAVETTSPATTNTNNPGLLAGMFESFLRRQGFSSNGMTKDGGFILLSESSPLTFALEQIHRRRDPNLCESGPNQPDQANDDENLTPIEHGWHPSHMAFHDITYLRSKGAFDLPEAGVLKALVEAFDTRFYPLYSIVDREEFQSLYHQQKLPWILLHAVCFIGATFCDASVIHQSSLKRRWQARQFFYDKTKVLFDTGYEANKIVLLQSVLMLTFWGPHMKSYWNPSSWVDFATTIAASLGIHRNTTCNSTCMGSKNRSLLRRLWWTVLARDASCATLLGRPFRIRMSQCDSDMLNLGDFNYEPSVARSDAGDGMSQVHALYQIHGSKLSLILRQIVQFQLSQSHDPQKRSELHALLKTWQLELPASVDWSKQADQKNIFATSLKIIFHHHLILLYRGKSEQSKGAIDRSTDGTAPLSEISASAAQVISSSVLSLMTSSSVTSLPHEVFPGFFIAGVVFYRQTQQQQTLLAQLRRSALDNCQMILNEARENSDAAQWMMRIFDFLLSSTPELKGLEAQPSSSSNIIGVYETGNGTVVDPGRIPEPHPNPRDFSLPPIDWELPLQQDYASMAEDFFISNMYIPGGGAPFDLRF